MAPRQSKRSESIPYDLALMDVCMSGMDGIEATGQIRDPQGPKSRCDHAIPIHCVDRQCNGRSDWEQCSQRKVAWMTTCLNRFQSTSALAAGRSKSGLAPEMAGSPIRWRPSSILKPLKVNRAHATQQGLRSNAARRVARLVSEVAREFW